MKTLHELLEEVRDRETFVRFVEALADERERAQEIERANPEVYGLDGALDWKNGDISGFFYAALQYFHPGTFHRPEAEPAGGCSRSSSTSGRFTSSRTAADPEHRGFPMEHRVQEVSREMLDLLGEDLSITWWVRPHRDWGWVKNFLVFAEEEGVIAVGQWQSGKHHASRGFVEIDHAHDHDEQEVDAGAIRPILDVLASTVLPWRRSVEPGRFFGGSHFGLRVEWDGFETERRWQGRLEDVDEVTLRLWTLVDPLVGSPLGS